MNRRVLIVPGYGNSGATHWQSVWESEKPGYWRRIQMDNWEQAVCEQWVMAIDHEVEALGPDTIVVAHSLGCLAVMHWAAQRAACVRGALLVAVPDPSGPAFPSADCIGFAPVPSAKLPFPSIVVASNDDPYATIGYARACAMTCGSGFIDVGARGHLNAASQLEDWTQGYRLLEWFEASDVAGHTA